MYKSLSGEKIAVLVANGFCETDLTQAQRFLHETGAHIRVVSMDNGLVNGWKDDNWGLNFAADQVLSEALAADYSMLLIPGGTRSIEKLKLTGHTRRFIGGFLDMGKPVAALDEALDLLAHAEKLDGRKVGGAPEMRQICTAAAAQWEDGNHVIDGNLMTATTKDADMAEMMALIRDFFMSGMSMSEAA